MVSRTDATLGGTLIYRRRSRLAVWLEQGSWVRFAAALLTVLLARAIETWGAAVVPLPLVPFAALASGLLLGPWGIAGAWAGDLLALTLAGTPGGWEPTLAGATASAVSGLGAWLVFRYVPTLGRGLPNLRSYLAVLAVAAAGGTLGALLTGAAWFPEGVRSLVSALLLAPPALLAMDGLGRRWMARIKDETLVERRFDLEALLPTDNEQTLALPLLARAEVRRVWLQGTVYVVGAAVLAVLVAGFVPEAEPWVPLLFLVPMLWAASSHGLRGALLVTAAASLLCLLGLTWTDAAPRPAELWSSRPDLLILSLAAALVGRSHEREGKLLQDLAERNRLLRRDLLRVAEALTHAVETKDSYTEGHLRRVSQYAVAVGEKLGVRGQDLEQLYVAGMLHDVGKLGVPEQVLHKEGPLLPHEEEIMRRHPEIGAKLLEKLEQLSELAPLVLHHQERFDGRRQGANPGYPRGLAGEEIPLGARIIAVVDAYDAMTTSRPYREALPVDDATATLRRERGRQFDPSVVDAFLDCLVERPWRIP